jgi:hypothetical protein
MYGLCSPQAGLFAGLIAILHVAMCLQSESVAAALTTATVKLLNLRQQLNVEQLGSVLAARVGLAVKSASLQALLSAALQLIVSAAGEATLVVPIGSLLRDLCTAKALPSEAADDARHLQVLLCLLLLFAQCSHICSLHQFTFNTSLKVLTRS